ncbi:MAG: hypothetical protein AMJ53_01500 [Gammaproteobacteria bacterium SG8_11]|nr:MAG: hypothetical protein AMJ53_01500 [Gammaproteobacteria bacterium SG8_11]
MATIQPIQPQTNPWPMYRTLVGIGLLCALVIVSVFEVTFPTIKINKQQALERAIFQVLPGAKSFAGYTLAENNNLRKSADSRPPSVYACFDSQTALIGFAIPAQGMGYQDTIGLLYGYSLQKQSIPGLVILQSRETPGLGSKIESDEFLRNFSQITITLKPGAEELEHPLELIKNTKNTQAWQIDAITGATVSSQAVVSILNRSLAFWLPQIAKQKERFTIEH